MKDLKLASEKWFNEQNVNLYDYFTASKAFQAGAQSVLDQAVEGFEEFINKMTDGKPYGVNRLDLHQRTWHAAKISSMKEIELRDSWVKHHQKTVEIKCAQLANLQAERDGIRASYEKLSESFDDLNVQNNFHAARITTLQAERKELVEALINCTTWFQNGNMGYLNNELNTIAPLIEKLKAEK